MADVAPASVPVPAPEKKTPKTKRTAGPNVRDLITDCVSSVNARKGASLIVIKKHLCAKGYDVERKTTIKTALKKLVEMDVLVHVSGAGAAGSFRLSKNKKAVTKVIPKKASVQKPKKVAAKTLVAKKHVKTPTKAARKAPAKVRKPPVQRVSKLGKRSPKAIKSTAKTVTLVSKKSPAKKTSPKKKTTPKKKITPKKKTASKKK